jgi:hypothetical protein
MTGLLDDLRWLHGRAGRAWLEQASESTEPLVRLATVLRKALFQDRQQCLSLRSIAAFPNNTPGEPTPVYWPFFNRKPLTSQPSFSAINCSPAGPR